MPRDRDWPRRVCLPAWMLGAVRMLLTLAVVGSALAIWYPVAAASTGPACPSLRPATVFEIVGGYVFANGKPAPAGTVVAALFHGTTVGCTSSTAQGTFRISVFGNDGTAATASYPKRGDPLELNIADKKATVTVTVGAVSGKQYSTLAFEDRTGWVVRAEATGIAASQLGTMPPPPTVAQPVPTSPPGTAEALIGRKPPSMVLPVATATGQDASGATSQLVVLVVVVLLAIGAVGAGLVYSRRQGQAPRRP